MRTLRSTLAVSLATVVLSAYGDTATLRIDTRTGVRQARRATEALAYSTAWNAGATGVAITLDGEPLFSRSGACAGDYVWDTSSATAGLHTLAFGDGVETLTAKFAIGGGALVACGDNSNGQCDLPEDLDFIQVVGGYDFSLGLHADGVVAMWGNGSLPYFYNSGFAQINANNFYWIGRRDDGSVVANGNWGTTFPVPGEATNSAMVAVGGYYDVYDDMNGWWTSYTPFFSLKQDGNIVGWTTSGTLIPIPERMQGAIAIDADYNHLLSLRSNGTVEVWYFGSGSDWDGVSNVPDSLANVKAVAAGRYFSMALKNDGSVVVWGDVYDNYGVRRIPVDATNVVEIAAGDYFCMARRADGRVICWGKDNYRETVVPNSVVGATDVGAGGYNGFAIVRPYAPAFTAEPVDVYCHVGQKATLAADVIAAPEAMLQWLKDGVPVAGADASTLVFDESVAADSGDYRIVASNAMGVVTSRVAHLTVDPSPAVDRIHRLTGAPFVGNRLVLRAKPYGDLSNATFAWKRDGVTVATTERLDIAALSASDFGSYTLVVSNPYGTATSEPYVLNPAPAGVPIGWGASDHGRTTAPEGLTGLVQIASGMNFNLGLSTNGTVTAWGCNEHGGCDVPDGLANVSFVTACGGYESHGAGFAVKRDGTVAAWGRPYSVEGVWDWRDIYDEFGDWIGDEEYWHEYTNGWDTVSTMPAGLSDVVKVAVGGYCAIALKADGSVISWGKPTYQWDSSRQMDVLFDFSTPDGLSDVVDVAAGQSHLMALKADGTVVAWNDGYTLYGECDVPNNLSDVVAMAAGDGASFAQKVDGTVIKWGRYNDFGIGAETNINATAIAVGCRKLMALDTDGNVRIWAGWDGYDLQRIPDIVTNVLGIAAGGCHCTALVPDTDGDSICDAEELGYGRDPLVWEAWRRSTVSGTVSTEFGPVEGARLWLFDASGTIRGTARTDETGIFRIDPMQQRSGSSPPIPRPSPIPVGRRGISFAGNLLPATYTLKIEAPGAVDAWYDGVSVGSGGTPTSIVVPGSTSIVLDVQLDPGQGPALAEAVCLEPDVGEEGRLVEVALPDGAVAYLDMWPTEMDEAGTIDLGEVELVAMGAASHTVTLKMPGAGAAVPSPVDVYGREGERIPVQIMTAGPRGSLSIATEPSGAEVFVDYADAPFGVTPLSVDNLLAGSHTILLRKDGYLRPRPVVAYVGGGESTEVVVPLNTAADTNEMSVAVSCVLPDQEIYLDYLPTGEVAPATVGGMDPASHAGTGWYSASHTILLKHPMVRPWAPRYVPEPSVDAETGETRYDSAIDIAGPQLYDDSDGDGVRNDIAIAEGRNPFYTLEEALDATNLVWTAGGDRRWRAVKTDAVPTGGYGQSGAIGNGQATWVETTVKGAGTLSFKWKTSCQRRLDMVRLSVDGVDRERLFGETDWTEVTVAVAGVTNHVLRWTFTRGASGSAGENGAWLDEVSWEPDTAANARTLMVASRYATCDPAPGDHALSWGDEVTVSASSYSNGLECATCTGWTGTGSIPATGDLPTATFTMEQDSTLTWEWSTEFMLDLAVEGEGSLSRESGWFAEGTTVVVAATPGLYQRFVRWEGDTADCRLAGATLRAPMTRGRSIRAVFEQDTRTVSVANCLGAAWPTNGVYTFDMGTELSAWSTNIVEEGRTRRLCTGWTGTGNVPATGAGTNAVFTLLEDSAIAWTWQTNYLVSVTVVGDGSVDFTEGWVEAGSNLVVTATPGNTAFTSAIWSGDIAGATPDGLRIAVPVDGPKEIAITFEALEIGRAVEQERRDWTTGVDGPSWIPVTEGTHDGVDACRSGSIEGDYGESILSATFSGPGDLSFWWRLGNSTSTCGIDLYVDGRDVNVWLVDATGWTQETITLGAGDHVLEWIFWGDGLDPNSAAWLDEVSFDGDAEPLAETQTTPVSVPYVWLDAFGLGDTTEAGYETAAKALAANGINTVWECYVAGLCPTNPASVLRATIRMEGGESVIEYDPARPAHTPAAWYKVDGKRDLGDAWTPKADGHRFFRVRIEVPEGVDGE